MHVGEHCTAYLKYPVLGCPTTIYVYKHVYTLNSCSWSEWDKTDRRRRFGYFGGGELETTDVGSGNGVHSSVYPYFDGFRGLGVWVLLVLGGYEYTPV
jgi:hypothetical protein